MLHHLAAREPSDVARPPRRLVDDTTAKRQARETARARFVLMCGDSFLADLIEQSDPEFPWEEHH